jgi:hypothetical protein
MEKQVLGFCAAIKHKLLLIKTLSSSIYFVLLMNKVFISCCSGISIFGLKQELLQHRKDKKQTISSENHAFHAAV